MVRQKHQALADNEFERINQLMKNAIFIVAAAFILAAIGVAVYEHNTGLYGNIEETDHPTQDELNRNWQKFKVYYRSDAALLYDIDDASTIRVDTAWVPVTSSEMLSQSIIWQTATVHNLLGPDGAMYGYLVCATGDSVSFKQVDQQTMRLFYQPARREKGPQY